LLQNNYSSSLVDNAFRVLAVSASLTKLPMSRNSRKSLVDHANHTGLLFGSSLCNGPRDAGGEGFCIIGRSSAVTAQPKRQAHYQLYRPMFFGEVKNAPKICVHTLCSGHSLERGRQHAMRIATCDPYSRFADIDA